MNLANQFKTSESQNLQAWQQAILDSADFTIISTDTQGIIQTINSWALRELGYEPQELIGKVTPAIIHDPQEVEQRAQQLSKDLGYPVDPGFEAFVAKARLGIADENIWTYIRKDHSRFQVCLSVTSLNDEAGNLTGFLGIGKDITKQLKIEQNLHESEARFAGAFEHAAIGMALVSIEGYWLQVNAALCNILGYPENELLTLTFQEITHPDDFESDLHHLERLIVGEISNYQLEKRYIHKLGHEVWSWLSVSLIRDNDTQPLYLVAQIQDISERKRAEAQTQQYAARLEASNRELEAFAYSVSHDLRAPLRAIDGFSRALQEDYGDTFNVEVHIFFERIRHNVARMSQMIDDLLSLSRVSRVTIQYQVVNLSALAQEVLTQLQTVEPDRTVVVEIAPEMLVSADVTLMRIVLSNLLQNAWKFTCHHPTAHIEFGVMDHEGQTTYFIRDDGAGFDMAYAQQLFGVFQRLHTTHEFPGTGIGLASVQRAIHRHGGTIWAEAAIEQGATFYFTL